MSAREMQLAVRAGIAALADGRLAQEVLERVWQTAYACGVRDGRKAPAAQDGFLAPQFLEQLRDKTDAALAGWGWATLAGHDLTAGQRFRYGGVDAARPVCDREAVIGTDGRLELADTGERVRPPVMFWARAGEGAGDVLGEGRGRGR